MSDPFDPYDEVEVGKGFAEAMKQGYTPKPLAIGDLVKSESGQVMRVVAVSGDTIGCMPADPVPVGESPCCNFTTRQLRRAVSGETSLLRLQPSDV